MSQTSQWFQTPPGASGSSTIKAKLFVPGGSPIQRISGETFSPSHVNRLGIAAPSLNPSTFTVNATFDTPMVLHQNKPFAIRGENRRSWRVGLPSALRRTKWRRSNGPPEGQAVIATIVDRTSAQIQIQPAVLELAILPLREGTLFPKAMLPLTLGRPGHIGLLLRRGERAKIGIIAQRDPRNDSPGPADLHDIGAIGHIHQILRVGPDHILAFCEGIVRSRVVEFTSAQAPLRARVQLLEDKKPPPSEDLRRLRDHPGNSRILPAPCSQA